MERTREIIKKNENIYYNVNISNSSNSPIPASFNANHTTPIVTKGDDYTVSVIRFFIPGTSIPIFNFFASPQPFVVTLEGPIASGGTASVSSVLIYDQTWNNTNVIGAIWSYQQFLALINTAMQNLFINQVPVFVMTVAPIIWFDTTEQLFKIRFSNSYDVINWRIYFSNSLFQLFPTFPAKHFGVNLANNKDYLLTSYLTGPDNVNSFPVNTFDFATEDNCQYAWNGLVRIYITSGSLKTRSELQYSSGGANISIPILTDFDPLVNGDWRVNNVFQYYPQGELRRVDITNDNPLTQIDFQFMYEDKYGNVQPMFLGSGKFISMKLLFQKKSISYF